MQLSRVVLFALIACLASLRFAAASDEQVAVQKRHHIPYPTPNNVPGALTNLVVTGIAADTIAVTMAAPITPSTIDSIRVFYRSGGAGGYILWDHSYTNGFYLEISGLSPSTVYDVKVKANNNFGTGPKTLASGSTLATTPGTPSPTPFASVLVLPAPVEDLALVRATATAAFLWWAPPSSGGAVQFFRIHKRIVPAVGGPGPWLPLDFLVPNDQYTYIVRSLNIGITYQFSVTSANELGRSSRRVVTTTTTGTTIAPTPPPFPPGPAENITCSITGPASLLVSWDAPSGEVDYYRIHSKESGAPGWTLESDNNVPSSIEVVGLAHCAQYNFKIRGVNHWGRGLGSRALCTTACTPVPTPLPTPIGTTFGEQRDLGFSAIGQQVVELSSGEHHLLNWTTTHSVRGWNSGQLIEETGKFSTLSDGLWIFANNLHIFNASYELSAIAASVRSDGDGGANVNQGYANIRSGMGPSQFTNTVAGAIWLEVGASLTSVVVVGSVGGARAKLDGPRSGFHAGKSQATSAAHGRSLDAQLIPIEDASTPIVFSDVGPHDFFFGTDFSWDNVTVRHNGYYNSIYLVRTQAIIENSSQMNVRYGLLIDSTNTSSTSAYISQSAASPSQVDSLVFSAVFPLGEHSSFTTYVWAGEDIEVNAGSGMSVVYCGDAGVVPGLSAHMTAPYGPNVGLDLMDVWEDSGLVSSYSWPVGAFDGATYTVPDDGLYYIETHLSVVWESRHFGVILQLSINGNTDQTNGYTAWTDIYANDEIPVAVNGIARLQVGDTVSVFTSFVLNPTYGTSVTRPRIDPANSGFHIVRIATGKVDVPPTPLPTSQPTPRPTPSPTPNPTPSGVVGSGDGFFAQPNGEQTIQTTGTYGTLSYFDLNNFSINQLYYGYNDGMVDLVSGTSNSDVDGLYLFTANVRVLEAHDAQTPTAVVGVTFQLAGEIGQDSGFTNQMNLVPSIAHFDVVGLFANKVNIPVQFLALADQDFDFTIGEATGYSGVFINNPNVGEGGLHTTTEIQTTIYGGEQEITWDESLGPNWNFGSGSLRISGDGTQLIRYSGAMTRMLVRVNAKVQIDGNTTPGSFSVNLARLSGQKYEGVGAWHEELAYSTRSFHHLTFAGILELPASDSRFYVVGSAVIGTAIVQTGSGLTVFDLGPNAIGSGMSLETSVTAQVGAWTPFNWNPFGVGNWYDDESNWEYNYRDYRVPVAGVYFVSTQLVFSNFDSDPTRICYAAIFINDHQEDINGLVGGEHIVQTNTITVASNLRLNVDDTLSVYAQCNVNGNYVSPTGSGFHIGLINPLSDYRVNPLPANNYPAPGNPSTIPVTRTRTVS